MEETQQENVEFQAPIDALEVEPKTETEEKYDPDKSLVTNSVIWRFVRHYDAQSSKELFEACNKKLKSLLLEAIDRAKSNGRRTVRPKDL